MANNFAHENNEIMKNLNKSGKKTHETLDQASIMGSSWKIHELGDRPVRESLYPSRRFIQLVNRDPVFQDAKRILGLFPQVAYKLVKSAGVDRARLVTAFIISLFESEYFTVDRQGRYDPSIPGNQERARNMLMGILYGKKPVYLAYAGPYFFQYYPEFRATLQNNNQATL